MRFEELSFEEDAKGVKVSFLRNFYFYLNREKLLTCHLCGECVELTNSAIKIEKTDDYVFYVESWGQITPKEIISTALDVLQEKTKEFEKELEKIK